MANFRKLGKKLPKTGFVKLFIDKDKKLVKLSIPKIIAITTTALGQHLMQYNPQISAETEFVLGADSETKTKAIESVCCAIRVTSLGELGNILNDVEQLGYSIYRSDDKISNRALQINMRGNSSKNFDVNQKGRDYRQKHLQYVKNLEQKAERLEKENQMLLIKLKSIKEYFGLLDLTNFD